MDRERLFRYLEERYASKRDMVSRIPLGIQPDALWQELINRRRSKSTVLPLTNAKGVPYWYVTTDRMVAASEKIIEAMYEENREIDPYTAAAPVSPLKEVFFTGYVEGMQMTLREAMEFLASDKPPRDIEEQLVCNNRAASSYAGGSLFRPVDASLLSELAGILTEGMDGGNGYRDTEAVEFSPSPGENFAYPPPALIPARVDELTAFLAGPSTHPLIKAGVAQIWMMAVRPFKEGNDRLGRLLSSMILLRAGYAFFADVSISSIIARKSYAYYDAVANVLREDGGGDLTYFLDHYLEVLSRAIEERKLLIARRNEQSMAAEREMAAEPLKPPVKTQDPIAFGEDAGDYGLDGFQIVSLDDRNKTAVKDAVAQLKAIAAGPTQLFSRFAGYILDRIGEGKRTFILREAGKALDVNPRSLSTCIRLLKEQGVVEHDEETDIHGLYRVLLQKKEMAVAVRNSDEPELTVSGLLDELAASTLSAKDRRIAAILRKCMSRGEVTVNEYRERGEITKWNDDMKLAAQLGLVEKITAERYRILTELKPGRSRMTHHQKKFITELYESFGTESFSREMLTATLDYSGTNVSAYLHKFTLLRILDCQKDGLLYLYQLRVNPEDHPECFDIAA